MNFGHKLSKSVKAYLLGSLNDDESGEIEARYFADPEFLRNVEIIERELIAEYLDGKLNRSDLAQFEQRYLRVPALQKRLEEVRREHAVTAATFPGRYAWVAAVVCALLLTGWWTVTRLGANDVTLRLTPGVTMAGEARMAEIDQPAAPATLRLELDYPSSETSLPARAIRLGRLDEVGRPQVIWTSGPSAARREATGLIYAALIEATLLSPGDYMAELIDTDSQRVEAYLFRIRPSRR